MDCGADEGAFKIAPVKKNPAGAWDTPAGWDECWYALLERIFTGLCLICFIAASEPFGLS